jgi:hypothetical protein
MLPAAGGVKADHIGMPKYQGVSHFSLKNDCVHRIEAQTGKHDLQCSFFPTDGMAHQKDRSHAALSQFALQLVIS